MSRSHLFMETYIKLKNDEFIHLMKIVLMFPPLLSSDDYFKQTPES